MLEKPRFSWTYSFFGCEWILAAAKLFAVASEQTKAGLLSALHLLAAGAVYCHLISGGWLTSRYQLDDPNILNLVLAVFEPIAAVSVVAYWATRIRGLYRMMAWLAVVQLLVGLGFLVFVVVFVLTWHPKLM